MFSNFTSNVTSWIGQNKDEEVPAPPPGEQPVEQPPAVEAPVEVDPNGEPVGDAKTGVFSSVSSKMTGWLGNASIPSMPAMAMPSMPAMPAMPAMPSIPGLRKGNAADEAGGIANEGLATSPEKEQPAAGVEGGDKDEDDRSRYISATEGADSRPQSAAGTPTEENAGKIGNVTAAAGKVTAGAKSFGSFLYSAVNKAGSKIKETVKDNTILGEFNKEQEAFAQSQAGQGEGVCPWIGHQNEDKIKEEILSLSADRRNFVRAPPAGCDFEFDYGVSYPVAQAIMIDDPALEKMRFELVPKIITEENFWRNYFYRVSLICQAGDLGTLGDDNEFGRNDVAKNTQTSISTNSHSNKNSNKSSSATETSPLSTAEGTISARTHKLSETEFVSDTFQKTSETDLEEIKAGMRKLGIDSLAQQAIETSDGKNEQWEKDLEAELQDYEVVNDGNDKTNWEKDVDELLDEDEDDLK